MLRGTTSDKVIDELKGLADDAKVVAIGETGLDYYYDNSPREQQRESFRRHIQLARELKLPVSVHLREAYEDAATILEEEQAWDVGGVIHCFSGTRAHAKMFSRSGTRPLLQWNRHFQERRRAAFGSHGCSCGQADQLKQMRPSYHRYLCGVGVMNRPLCFGRRKRSPSCGRRRSTMSSRVAPRTRSAASLS